MVDEWGVIELIRKRWQADPRQTPTFSAKPVVAAALDAVRRGVLVEIYADLGYDEKVS